MQEELGLWSQNLFLLFLTKTEEKLYDLSAGVVRDHCNTNKSKAIKSSTGERTPRLRVAKESASARRQTTAQPKIYVTGSKRESLPVPRAPSGKSSTPTWRASLPIPTRGRNTTNFYTDVGYVDSPDVSVDAPQIDRIAEFAMASYEDPFFHVIRRSSSASAKCFSSTAGSADCTITKDKCTILVDKKVTVPTSTAEAGTGVPFTKGSASECSNYVTAGVSSRSSSESREHRFDTSSYQQRADALEGLLEFSARLLQQHRFDELGVLLKPFGPEKVSPRETAIWLAKSFKQNCDLRFPHTLT
ncbi:serine/threonine-protein kinase nek2-like protein [Trifolium pratense]|uniref:Serine/threonine-protein kinase nek2-like protein n=1 Tax=Trifolium pratense TaxID=57577 RepID=A0A2K3MPS3_TRIPR|nr:serine/threonine-protein kinase nek2-like protein [Trifolium pratense]